MNIQLQLCGLMIVVFLMILSKSHKTLGLAGERNFFVMLILTIACIFLDALSVVAIHYFADSAPTIAKIFCKAYLVSMIWVGWIDFCYVNLDLNSTMKNHRKSSSIMACITLVESIVIAVLPIGIHNEGNDVYTYGLAVYFTYAFTLLYILSILNVSIFILKKKNSRRGMAVAMTTSLWILAAGIQFFNNELLLVGFSMAIGVMILYIVLENPDAYLDRILGCFNTYALHSYISMKMEKGTGFSILDIYITDVKALEDKGLVVKDAARTVINHLESNKKVMIFKNLGTGLVVVSKNEEDLKELSDFFMKTVAQYEEANNSIMVFTVKDAQRFGSTEELLKFLTYVRSKSTGRLSSTVHVSEEMISSYNNIQNIEKEIQSALEEDRVEAFLQPICSVPDERVVSAEALARIRNKDGSLLSPGVFIPVAETTGQVNKIGERVLEKVCRFLKETEATSLGIRTVHVNLSAVQCDDNSTVGRLCKIVEQYGIDPKYISFEITETAVSTAKDVLIENMNALIAKGFSFALDDFGKGESNLMYIVEMPVELLKLDMDMSKAFFANQKAKVVVGAVSDMARKLHLPIVAEGIESKEEVEGITAEGITHIQGYYYSRPLPMDQFIEYLKKASLRNAEHLQYVKEQENTATQQNEKTEEKEKDTRVRLKGRHILLVEDNELNAEIAEEILTEFGYQVQTVNDGVAAVDTVSKSKPGQFDLVLMDIRMPIMDGYEATRRIRALQNKALAGIPIFALTSLDTEESLKAEEAVGMNRHLTKPIDIAKLESMLLIEE